MNRIKEEIKYDLVRSALFVAGVIWAGRSGAARIIRLYLYEDGDQALSAIKARFPGIKKGVVKK